MIKCSENPFKKLGESTANGGGFSSSGKSVFTANSPKVIESEKSTTEDVKTGEEEETNCLNITTARLFKVSGEIRLTENLLNTDKSHFYLVLAKFENAVALPVYFSFLPECFIFKRQKRSVRIFRFENHREPTTPGS